MTNPHFNLKHLASSWYPSTRHLKPSCGLWRWVLTAEPFLCVPPSFHSHSTQIKNKQTKNAHTRFKLPSVAVRGLGWLRICMRPTWGSTPSLPPAVIVSISSPVLRKKKTHNAQGGVEGENSQPVAVLTVFRVRLFLLRLHSHTLRLIRAPTGQLPWKCRWKKHQ